MCRRVLITIVGNILDGANFKLRDGKVYDEKTAVETKTENFLFYD